ncbi:hypothetical protein GS461_07855 [Rhodococcus hoagii]|nr:hypothetical protein [Prescottella equi]
MKAGCAMYQITMPVQKTRFSTLLNGIPMVVFAKRSTARSPISLRSPARLRAWTKNVCR